MKITRHFNSESQFVTALTLLFSAAIGIGLWRHEMWRDEYHAWGLVLNSNSFSQMLSNLRGEGHLPFSYIIFYFISRITANPHAVQIAQFFVAIACAYLLLRFAPFKRWQKVLLLFGYFPLYEYGVISRSYTWDMLGLFGFCAVYGWAKEHQRKPWLAWLFLVMMATNESFGILLALPLAGLLIWDLCTEQKIRKATWIWTGSITAVIAALLGYLLLRVISINQWAGLAHRFPNTASDVIGTTAAVVGRAVLPKIHLPRSIWDIPSLKSHFLMPHEIWQYAAWVVVIIVALAFVFCLLRLLLASVRLPFNLYNRPPAFAVWMSGTALLFLFLWSSGGSIDDARHTGHFYLFFIGCWWLATYFPKNTSTESRWLRHVHQHAKYDFRFLLLAQLAFGLFAYGLDIVYLFSANQATATYLQTHHLQHAALVAPESIAIASGREAYFPQYDIVAKNLPMRDNSLSTFLRKPAADQLAQRTWRYIKSKNTDIDVVVVSNTATTDIALQKYFQWQSPPAIINSEQYFVYFVPRGALGMEKI